MAVPENVNAVTTTLPTSGVAINSLGGTFTETGETRVVAMGTNSTITVAYDGNIVSVSSSAAGSIPAGTSLPSSYALSLGAITITAVGSGTTTLRFTPSNSTYSEVSIPITVGAPADDESYLDKRGLTHFWENIDDIKQNKLTAGAGILITNDVISATGGGTADAVDWGHITGSMSNQTDLTTALAAKANSADLATVATSGDYDDLTDKPTIGNATLTIQKNGTSAGTFTANATSNKTINITVPTSAADVSALPASTKYGASIAVSINTTDYKVTTTLKDQDGNTLGTAQVIDLPLESVVVNGSYDSTNKKIVLTLQNGNTIDIPVGDLVAGLQSEITSTNKLDSDLVDDTGQTNKFMTSAEKTKLSGIAAGAEVNVQSDWNQTTTTADDYIKNKPSLATVATSGSYNDLSNKPTIPAAQVNSDWNATSGKAQILNKPTLATVATSGSYNDLSNKPTIPAAQVQSDWTQTTTTAVDYIKNKPTLATVATSGSYNDLSNKPTIPTVNNATLTIQKNGTNVQTFTANQSTNATANITVPTKTSELTNDSGYTTNTGTITQVKLDGANVATSGVANVQAIPTVIGSSSVGGSAGDITSLKKYGSVNYNGSIIGTNILNLSVNRFYHCYERGATITCNYFSNPNEFCNGAYSKWDSSVNPSTAFTATPFVLEIKKTSSFEMTDVSRLLLIGHRLYGELMATKYKIEVAYAYSNNTYSWDTVIDYDGAAVDICQKFYGLYCSDQGSSSSPWHSIFGVRLTISGSTSTIFKLADVQLICGRGTEQPYESIHALSDAGGTVYGNVNITGSLQHGSYTYTLPNKNGTVAMTSDIPSVPTVNNGQLTIQKNGTNVATFTANQSGNATANIAVPTKTSDLTNDSGFVNSTAIAGKQDLLTAGDHINITGTTIKAVDYVHSEQPVATSSVTPVITGSMISNGTITADKLASDATVKLTLSTSDIGEGAALAANTLYGVYI